MENKAGADGRVRGGGWSLRPAHVGSAGLRTSPVLLWFPQRRLGGLPRLVTCSKHGGLVLQWACPRDQARSRRRVPASSGSGRGGSSGERREPSPPIHAALLMEGDRGCWVIMPDVCAGHACAARRETETPHKRQGARRGGREAPGMSAAGLQAVCMRERACVSARACVFVYKRVYVQVLCVCASVRVCGRVCVQECTKVCVCVSGVSVCVCTKE